MRDELLKDINEQLNTILNKLESPSLTGRIRYKNSMKGLTHVYIISPTGEIIKKFISSNSIEFIRKSITQGNIYFDVHSARLASTRIKVLHKIWCKFGGNVVWLPFEIGDCSDTYQGVHFLKNDRRDFDDNVGSEINTLLNRLTKDELNSIRIK